MFTFRRGYFRPKNHFWPIIWPEMTFSTEKVFFRKIIFERIHVEWSFFDRKINFRFQHGRKQSIYVYKILFFPGHEIFWVIFGLFRVIFGHLFVIFEHLWLFWPFLTQKLVDFGNFGLENCHIHEILIYIIFE